MRPRGGGRQRPREIAEAASACPPAPRALVVIHPSLAGSGSGRDGVVAGQPAAEIHLPAARRAEGAERAGGATGLLQTAQGRPGECWGAAAVRGQPWPASSISAHAPGERAGSGRSCSGVADRGRRLRQRARQRRQRRQHRGRGAQRQAPAGRGRRLPRRAAQRRQALGERGGRPAQHLMQRRVDALAQDLEQAERAEAQQPRQRVRRRAPWPAARPGPPAASCVSPARSSRIGPARLRSRICRAASATAAWFRRNCACGVARAGGGCRHRHRWRSAPASGAAGGGRRRAAAPRGRRAASNSASSASSKTGAWLSVTRAAPSAARSRAARAAPSVRTVGLRMGAGQAQRGIRAAGQQQRGRRRARRRRAPPRPGSAGRSGAGPCRPGPRG